MKAVLDSSALVPLINEADALRPDALRVRDTIEQYDYQLLLPYEVCAETLNVIGRILGRKAAVAAGQQLLALCADQELTFVQTEPHTISRALTLQQSGKGSPSFVDCLVMAVADNHGTPYIFGFDATFKKNGYSLPSTGDARLRAA